jgi:16S rRNA G527 N7-methylase RsmG
LRARAEELAMDPSCQGTFDLCLARAVGGRESLLSAVASLLQPGGRLITSGREQERGPWPETESFAFEEKRKVALPSVGLERSLLIWQRRK